jgi:hypothetical protein
MVAIRLPVGGRVAARLFELSHWSSCFDAVLTGSIRKSQAISSGQLNAEPSTAQSMAVGLIGQRSHTFRVTAARLIDLDQ